MKNDPPDFAEDCSLLLGFINLGASAFVVDVPALDRWMAANAGDDSRDKYLRKRRVAVNAYLEYRAKQRRVADAHWADGLDVLREAVEDMHGIVNSLRAQVLAHAKAKADQLNRKISTLPRMSARSPLKAAVLQLMKAYRSDDVAFKVFMQAWAAEALYGLRLVETAPGSGQYIVTDENGDDYAQRQYTSRTLQLMYSRAMK